nr:hypothetical protein [Methylomarinovum caldicuralii]
MSVSQIVTALTLTPLPFKIFELPVKPGRQVFGAGVDAVEGFDVVQKPVIQAIGQSPGGRLDGFEIDGNTDVIQHFGFYLGFDFPVMPMQAAAIAGVIAQGMGGAKLGLDFQGIEHPITHISRPCSKILISLDRR